MTTDATHTTFYLVPGGMHTGATINGRNLTVIGRKTEVTGAARYFFHVQSGRVTLRGLVLDNNTASDGAAVFCDGSTAQCRIEDSTIERNLGVGVRVKDAALELRRSVLDRNASGAVDISNSAGFQIENDFFYKNGQGNGTGTQTQQFGAINIDLLAGAGPANIVNSSFFDNHAEAGIGTATWSASITCAFVSSRSVTIAGDIFWKNAPVRIGASNTVKCEPRYSLSDDPMVPAATNKTGDPLFKSESTPVNLHLKVASPAKDGADPAVAPADDIDGKPRDTMPDIGADELDP